MGDIDCSQDAKCKGEVLLSLSLASPKSGARTIF